MQGVIVDAHGAFGEMGGHDLVEETSVHLPRRA
jgi:hypothetical protein